MVYLLWHFFSLSTIAAYNVENCFLFVVKVQEIRKYTDISSFLFFLSLSSFSFLLFVSFFSVLKTDKKNRKPTLLTGHVLPFANA